MRLFFILSISVFICGSCHDDMEKNLQEDKLYPSDYLYAQRAYPHNAIDIKAYQDASKQALNDRISSHKNFNKPWTSQGPANVSGRVTDIEMPIDNQEKIYVGTASGGIFLSEDFGNEWRPIFDDNPTLAIGNMAIDKNNTDIIYVGTGESNAGGGSIAYDGMGIYRSDDAGESWKSCGLSDVGSIGRVVIDPDNSDIVTVAAMGHLFENNPERGVYQTRDGGESWERKLFLSDSTGAVDLSIHPENGQIIYAAMWERIRRPYNRQYGGATTGLYRSTDGGESWAELSSTLPSLPSQKGRIGIDIAESDPNVLYAVYADQDGNLQGVYKTSDGGDSWTSTSTSNISEVSFMWWFGRITISPHDSNDVYVSSINMSRSTDGGNSWESAFVEAHVDHHAMYIHPENPDIVINGNDGGVNIGEGPDFRFSEFSDGINNFQFYTCKIDPDDQQKIYGGAQDNGTQVTTAGSDSWEKLFGGDGFRVLVDPNNTQQIYLEFQYGNIYGSSNGGNSFYFAADGVSGASNWNTPIAMDPNITSTIYTGTQRLYKSEDKGRSWIAISGILTNQDNPIGNLDFGTLTTIDVSTLDSDIIYIGTDDGNVWVTKDGGVNYQNISNGLPKRWITSVAHHPNNRSTVLVTVSGFRFGESSSQVFISDNMGEEWLAIGESLPDIPVNDLIVDINLPNVFYVATDIGVYVTSDAGGRWQRLGMDMPIVPVTDIDYHSNSLTLAAATFGRGMYTYLLSPSVSVEENVRIKLSVFPNPTTSFLNVNTEGEISQVKIYNISGEKIETEMKDNTINVEHLQSGTYFLRVSTDFGEKTTRFIKI